MRRATLLMYAPTPPLEIHPRLPFVEFSDQAQGTVNRAIQIVGGHARVLVFPYGGSPYPIL